MRQKEQQGFIKNIIIISIVLIIVFLSQQGSGRLMVLKFNELVKPFFSQAGDWVMGKIYPTIVKETQKGSDLAQSEVQKQKENFLKTVWENMKKYFAEKFSKTFGTKVE